MYELRPYQHEANEALLNAVDGGMQRPAAVLPTGSGKGHPLSIEVPTPNGLRLWGDLRPGDEIFGSNGTPTEVTAVYDRGEQDIYQVTMSDGSVVETDADHLWQINDQAYRRTTRRSRLVSTRELAQVDLRLERGYRFRIPMAGLVHYPERELSLEPYTLGALLANGSLVNGALQLTTPDADVVERIRKHYTVTKVNDRTPGVCPRYRIAEVRSMVRALGIDVYSVYKRVPRQYLEASVEQRIALLQGLMDGDGSSRAKSGRRSMLYHSTSTGLLSDAQELVTSLGGNASVDWSERGKKSCGAVRILLPEGVPAFSSARKSGVPDSRRVLGPRRAIVSVEKVRRETSRCITVAAENSLYLVTRNHVVTHNTIIFADLILRLRRRKISRVLVIAHRGELLEQAAEKIRAIAPHLKVGVVKGERNEVRGCHVVVASVQTLSQRRRCNRPKQERQSSNRCGQCTPCTTLHRAAQVQGVGAIVVDEAHHASARTYRDVLTHYGAFVPMGQAGVPVFGFTATMAREEGGLAHVWDDVVYTREIADMISEGYLVPPHAKQVVVPGMDLDRARTQGGDFTQKSLADMMLDADAMSEIAKAYVEYASERPGIVFSPTVEVAEAMTTAFNNVGLATETLWGTMSDDHRRAVLERFSSGETQVLSNCGILTEGFDEPKASCLVVARPTKSAGLYIQMAGRILRPAPGKSDALILDVTGVTTRHTLASVVDLTGKQAQQESVEREEEEDEEEPEPEGPGSDFEKEILRIEGWQDVDFDQMRRAQRRARWLQTPAGYWFVKVGDYAYFPVPAYDEGYYHSRVLAGGEVQQPPGNPAYSMEQIVTQLEKLGTDSGRVGKYDDPDADWRKSTKVSDAQREFARKLKIEVPETVTKGWLNDEIDSRKIGKEIDVHMAKHKRALDIDRKQRK